MGRSNPHRRLSCAVCRKRDYRRVRMQEQNTGFYEPTWFGIKVIGLAAPESRRALCKCLNCGHEYVSDSTAAHRALRGLGLID